MSGHTAPLPDEVGPGSGLAAPALQDRYARLLPDDRERERFRVAVDTLGPYQPWFLGRRVLDYGASWGTSLIAALRWGAAAVEGVEVDGERVAQGQAWIRELGLRDRARIHHTPDTTRLAYPDGAFRFVLVSAVLEHIPQPRDAHLRELWRLVAPGGVMLVRETPNKYFPLEVHTTQLWFNHWLPKAAAHRRAVRRGRFAPHRTDWDSSGWRGLGFWEMARALPGYRLIPERSALRHRVLSAIGLPASLMDPYPEWLMQKLP